MKLIVGLGNPEARYDGTRHNLGFAMLDHYAARHSAAFRPQSKFHADIATVTIDDEKVLLAKPTTYYNESGRAVQAIAHFYQLAPHDVLVVHDELALPLGTVRTRMGGSDAGNNGVKSINALFGPDTARLRIGTGAERPPAMNDADFVLGRFTADEQPQLAAITDHAAATIDAFVAGDLEPTTHRH